MGKHGLSPSSSERTEPRKFRGLMMIGGHAALDLVNSVEYRGGPEPNDVLDTYANLVAWAKAAAVIDEDEAALLLQFDQETCRLALEKTKAFRESLRLFLVDRRNESARKAVLDAISGLRFEARDDEGAAGAITLTVAVRQVEDLFSRIVDRAKDLLLRLNEVIVRECEGCNCDWLFIDATKSRRRRWCHSSICGNAARVRRFRASAVEPSSPFATDKSS